jgi:tetratricopeptide (TPR) repeat protein
LKRIFQNKYIATFLIALVLFSCSTEKNTFVNRNYFNLTARYNIYFNGNEAMKGGLYKIDTRVEEDYTKILPVFKESIAGTETMVSSDMNVAIEKGTKLIKTRSITRPPERDRTRDVRKRKPVKPEYNNWVDDAYIMMGRAYLYQKNYIMAASTFTHVIRRFSNEPVKFDALLWLARTYSESGRYTEARDLIESLEGDNKFPKKLEGELAIVAADLFLKQNRFDEAIPYLNIGIKKISGNSRKTRYNFILGQLYQEQGDQRKALEAYQRVIRRRPDYEMLFNARINSARAFSGDGNVASLRKELTKMSKKKRNEPYLDQIYYALGNILYNEGRIDDAMKLYRQSAAVSTSNTYQRILSCLTLSDIYFDRRDYIPSGRYLDSAVIIMEPAYPNFKSIEQKHFNLNRLVTNLVAVETQDSLQHLATLSKEELDTKVNEWVDLEKRKMEAFEASGSEADFAGAYGRSLNPRMRLNTESSGGFYFYNPSTVAYGKQEFKNLWGDRKNEDHWRRRDKSVAMFDEMGEPLTDGLDELLEDDVADAGDPTTKEFYLKNIPDTEEKMAKSHNIIRDALYDAGVIFKTEFNDFERSIECFNELNRRYPGNQYELPGYFNLWDLYKIVQKPDSSTIYKNKILDKFPESNYARYLTNPNYFIELEAKKDSVNQAYSQAFTYYQNRDFRNAFQQSSKVLAMNPDSLLKPKARFIQMVSSSRGLGDKRFADSLKTYIDTYPKAEPTVLAKQIFDLIKEDKLSDYDQLVKTGYVSEVIRNLELFAGSQQASGEPVAAKWDASSELLHFFVIAYPNDISIDVNRLRFDIANYNIDYYTTLDFDIETESLNSDTRLVVVRNFGNKDASLIYFLSIIRKPDVFKTLAGHQFYNFVISNNNFREMMNDKAYEKYLQFFVKNYSIFTTGEFPEEDLESPEELMARLTRDDDLVEQGQFVVVETDDGSYQAPGPIDEIFTFNYDVPHSYVVVINEARYRTGFIMRDMVKFNTDNHREKRLRVAPVNLANNTTLLVSSFNNAYQASLYAKEANDNKAMFQSLGDTPYQTYIISNDNFDKLRETNKLEEWELFHRRNYIQRRPTAPRTEADNAETAAPKPEEKPVSQQVGVEPVPQQKPAVEEQAVKITETQAEPAAIRPQPETVQQQQPLQQASEVAPEQAYSGPYQFNAEAPHRLVYLVPSSGSNKTLLVTYLNRLNATNFRGESIEVSEVVFDDYRSLIVISSFAGAEKAKSYRTVVDADSRITMSLRNANHKSYLISEENLKLLIDSKDINGYQSFYNGHY